MNFSEEVSRKLGNYIYRLIDPRNGETFYVGKGTGNRVFQHANDPKNMRFVEGEDDLTTKLHRIREIRTAGLAVIYLIHRHDVPDQAIFEVEAAVIDSFPGLSNSQGGHGSGSKGPMSILEINNKYALPEIDWEPTEKLILLNINRLDDRSSIDAVYKQVRLAWRIDQARADNADYVLAVVRGVVIGVFKANCWLAATHANFPDEVPKDRDMPSRKGFIGCPAPDLIWEKYVGSHGKRIVIDGMKHVQNPVRFWPN